MEDQSSAKETDAPFKHDGDRHFPEQNGCLGQIKRVSHKNWRNAAMESCPHAGARINAKLQVPYHIRVDNFSWSMQDSQD